MLTQPITPDLLCAAYAQGLFPMANSADDPHVHWYCPKMRGQLSIPDMHIPRSLKKAVRQAPYRISINTAFREVITQCAQTTDNRTETWINPAIIQAFCDLHAQGHAHSVECWQGDNLVGGLYGVAIGGLFCGESMFSRAPNASKIALVHLVARLWAGGFKILDTQFTNDHLVQFGIYEIPHDEYLQAIQRIITQPADFMLDGQSQRDIAKRYMEMRKNPT